MVCEDCLKLSDALSPDRLDINSSSDSLNSHILWKLDQESSVEWIVRINDLVGVLRVVVFGIFRFNS